MTDNNEILRKLRYALDFSDQKMLGVFALKELKLSREQLKAYMGREDDEGAIYCPDETLGKFLDGLIIEKRGPPKNPQNDRSAATELSNNQILKKLRIAFTLQESDMLSILEEGGKTLSKGELTALFRKPSHKHYRPCGNQILRKFLTGLGKRLRSQS